MVFTFYELFLLLLKSFSLCWLKGRRSFWTGVIDIVPLLLLLSFNCGWIQGLIFASTVNIGIMKVPGFWVLFAVVATILICLNFSSSIAGCSFPDLVSINCGDSTKITVSRKLKENRIGRTSNKKGGMGDVTLDDYQPIDPVPSSKTSVKPGPIEHGSPLIPFIPKPSPPVPPNAGGSP
ncbi:uncharacterized protein LOC129318856 [Prosopis cineraria]|uniref:uncharacterized protein LOC129318856 n=1 Tax=Prosopis cineraria TaxID=364024 RepID=UPI00240F92F6|nr:uncharacterized protein LOC129318856 [Prosopis cineraria]XP_054819808.1 uncharacterized protein LOC129318856 [Prosopis cineraria]